MADDDDFDALEEQMRAGGKKRKGRKAKGPIKPTPPPLPSDSPMRQELEETTAGPVQTLPPEPEPVNDEEAIRDRVLARAKEVRDRCNEAKQEFERFVQEDVRGNTKLSAFQRAWFGSSWFHFERGVDHLDVALRGKVEK